VQRDLKDAVRRDVNHVKVRLDCLDRVSSGRLVSLAIVWIGGSDVRNDTIDK